MRNSALPQLRSNPTTNLYPVPLLKIKRCKCSAFDKHDIWIASFKRSQSKIDGMIHATRVRDVPELSSENRRCVSVCVGPQGNAGYHFIWQHWAKYCIIKRIPTVQVWLDWSLKGRWVSILEIQKGLEVRMETLTYKLALLRQRLRLRFPTCSLCKGWSEQCGQAGAKVAIPAGHGYPACCLVGIFILKRRRREWSHSLGISHQTASSSTLLRLRAALSLPPGVRFLSCTSRRSTSWTMAFTV